MNAPSNALHRLALRLGGDLSQGPQRFRENLEAGLVPMIRCALRTGQGAAPLVQWVSRHLPKAPTAGPAPAQSPDLTAPIMARQLCADLMRQYQPRPALETVVGR